MARTRVNRSRERGRREQVSGGKMRPTKAAKDRVSRERGRRGEKRSWEWEEARRATREKLLGDEEGGPRAAWAGEDQGYGRRRDVWAGGGSRGRPGVPEPSYL